MGALQIKTKKCILHLSDGEDHPAARVAPQTHAFSLLRAAHPFSVLAAPGHLTHPSISLPQLPISRWPSASTSRSITTLTLWKKKIHRDVLSVICSVWESNPPRGQQGPSWSVFNQVGFFAVRLSWAKRHQTVEKCLSSTPTWEFYFLISSFFCYNAKKKFHFSFISSYFFFFFLMGHKNIASGQDFIFLLFTHSFDYCCNMSSTKNKKKRSVVAVSQ